MENRHLKILGLARERGRVEVASLVPELGVAAETIRRDLRVLVDRGVLRRVHGGAVAVESAGHESGIDYRTQTNVGEKRRIAAAAALSDELLATVLDQFAECPVPDAELGFLHLGGALNEHAEDDGAVGNRNAQYVLGVNGMWEPNEPRADAYRQWIRDAWQRQRPFATGRTYINFQTADDSQERVRASYGANYARLVDINEDMTRETCSG